MVDRKFTFTSAADGMAIQAYAWRPASSPRAVVVIAHGAAEHALRYERFARALNAVGIEAWAADHRGHGRTAGLEGRGKLGAGGWNALVGDFAQLVEMARAEHGGRPVAVFGHSMGSSVAQQYAPAGSRSIEALVLSGSTARVRTPEGQAPAAFEPNKAFEPARTPFDWLSRDEGEVDKYVDDPFCGFAIDWRSGANRSTDGALFGDQARLREIRADLPVLLVAGDADAVNRKLAGLELLERWYREAGVRRVDTLYYAGGRHEMLNETNRDEVTADIIGWLREVVQV